MSRDWTQTLFPASYGGSPFWVESDAEEGGRRIAVHEFPHNDVPFLEDMGDGPKRYRVTGYLVGDTADSDSHAVARMLSVEGAATLVLPIYGPFPARAVQPWTRRRDRDRAGYIAFEMTFIREGLATYSASAGYSLALAFDAVSALSVSIASLAATVAVAGQPGWINDATVAALDEIPAALESVRTTTTTDPQVSAAVSLANVQAMAAIPQAVSGATGLDPALTPSLVANAVALASGVDPATGQGAFAQAVSLFPAPAPSTLTTQSAFVLQRNAAKLAAVGRLTLISAYATSLLKAAFDNRPDAVAARALMNEMLDQELIAAVAVESLDLITSIAALRAAVSDYLTTLATTLKPIVIVTAPRALPAVLLAYRLYNDPTRWSELVARNNVKHPSFMPLRFDALAA